MAFAYKPPQPRRRARPGFSYAQRAVDADSQLYGRRHRPDYGLLVLTIILLAIGIVVVYAISPALAAAHNVGSSYYVNRQLIAILLSVVVFTLTSQFPINRWRMLYKVLLAVAALGTVVALLMPVNPDYPAHRWIRLGSLSFQSVELLKFALLVWVAGFLADRISDGTITNMKLTLRPLLIAIAVLGVIVAGVQSDLGSTGVMVAMIGAMTFVAGMPLKKVLLIAGLIMIGTVLAISVTPYRRDRLTAYLHPGTDCQNTGYQACQALIAVGSGGLIGQGLGRGVQAFGYLPEAENDSIFAVYAEKFGFIGVSVLIGLFVAFLGRMKRVAERAPDMFSRLLVVGVLTWLCVQAMINIGAMIGLLPLKGITLPFISYGGTSVLFAMAAVGLVFQVSRYTSYRTSTVDRANRDNNAPTTSRMQTVRPRGGQQ